MFLPYLPRPRVVTTPVLAVPCTDYLIFFSSALCASLFQWLSCSHTTLEHFPAKRAPETSSEGCEKQEPGHGLLLLYVYKYSTATSS